MRLSKKSEYGLRALIELTKAYNQSALRRSDIAETQQIPVGFLETILLELKRAGILGSRPGVQGGYRLIKPPEDVSLGQVIRILDGPLAPIPCVSQTAYQTCQDCPYAETRECPIQSVMFDVRTAVANVLDRYTLRAFYDRGRNRRFRKSPKRQKGQALGRTQ
ncbi:MAG: Rrf2 family transcriptional regulator [Nitrospira sp.]|nr:Rrf2 family transcriptional regulator [Nitrospira sp.]